jgi:hypothetical protein
LPRSDRSRCSSSPISTGSLRSRWRTTLAVLVEYPTKEGRDAHINSGMEAGMQDAMDLLEQVAVSLR